MTLPQNKFGWGKNVMHINYILASKGELESQHLTSFEKLQTQQKTEVHEWNELLSLRKHMSDSIKQ